MSRQRAVKQSRRLAPTAASEAARAGHSDDQDDDFLAPEGDGQQQVKRARTRHHDPLAMQRKAWRAQRAVLDTEEALRVAQLEEALYGDDPADGSGVSTNWSSYRALLRQSGAPLPPDDGEPGIPGWLYVANDTLQQHRPAGFVHRYECGFTTLPIARLRNFFTHNLDVRWLMTVPVTDVRRANKAALATLVAAGARIIPGRIKWFCFDAPALNVQCKLEGQTKTTNASSDGGAVDVLHPPLLTTRMILDWIRSSVQPWRDPLDPVYYHAGPAQHVQSQLIANYLPDAQGHNQVVMHRILPVAAGAAAVAPAPCPPLALVVPPAAAAHAVGLPLPPSSFVHVPRPGFSASSRHGGGGAHSSISLSVSSARAAADALAAAALPLDLSDAALRRRRNYRHGHTYADDDVAEQDGEEDDDCSTVAQLEDGDEQE